MGPLEKDKLPVTFKEIVKEIPDLCWMQQTRNFKSENKNDDIG